MKPLTEEQAWAVLRARILLEIAGCQADQEPFDRDRASQAVLVARQAITRLGPDVPVRRGLLETVEKLSDCVLRL